MFFVVFVVTAEAADKRCVTSRLYFLQAPGIYHASHGVVSLRHSAGMDNDRQFCFKNAQSGLSVLCFIKHMYLFLVHPIT